MGYSDLPPSGHPATTSPGADAGKGGRYRIWPASASGELLLAVPADGVPQPGETPNPYDERAVEIFYGLLDTGAMPPHEQLELQSSIDKVLRVVQRLYLQGEVVRKPAFRIYYVRLFNVARIGLEGSDASPALGQLELARITADLLDDEGGHVKNAHLRTLAKYAAWYALPFLALYALVCLLPEGGFHQALGRLRIDPDWLAGFCMLWVGCFNGVCLSYGIRKTRIGLADLLVGEDDRMLPHIRLLFAGSLACGVGLMFALKIVDVQLGKLSVSDITGEPALAFLVGLLLGVAELALPASLGRRSGTLAAAVS